MKFLRSELLAALIAAVSSAAPLVLWQSLNQRYPDGDNAYYMITGLQIYRRFMNEGFLAGIHDLYFYRGWKPILHPILSVPAFFVSGGRVLPAQTVVMTALLFAFAATTYWIARRYLGKIASIICGIFVSCAPWTMGYAQELGSELPFMLFSFITIGFLIRSDFLTGKRETALAAVFLGLTACTRPAETPVLFAIPVLALFAGAFVTKKRPRAVLFLMVAALTAAAWLAPFWQTLLDWTMNSSFQHHDTQKWFPRTGLTLFAALIGQAYFGWMSGCLLAATGLSLFLRRLLGKRNLSRELLWGTAALVGSLALHGALASMSFNPDTRYYCAEIAAIYLGVLLIFFSSLNLANQALGHALEWSLGLGLVAFVWLPQLSIPALRQNDSRLSDLRVALGAGRYWTPLLEKDPAVGIVDQILARDPQSSSAGKAPHVALLNSSEKYPMGYFEAFLMRLISLERGREIDFECGGRTYFMNDANWDAWLANESKTYDFALLAVYENDALRKRILGEKHSGLYVLEFDSHYEGEKVTPLWLALSSVDLKGNFKKTGAKSEK